MMLQKKARRKKRFARQDEEATPEAPETLETEKVGIQKEEANDVRTNTAEIDHMGLLYRR